MLVLEDLTRGDVDRFVRGLLQQDERFVREVAKDPRVDNFIDEILNRANGVFLWVFTFWCFAVITVSTVSDMVERDENGKWGLSMKFHNTWWAFIFPNVGFTLSTIYLGQEFESEAVLWVATAMVVLLVIFWLFDMVTFFKAITYSIIWDSRVKLS